MRDIIFTIRLFPEITVKSSPVRKRWTKHLADNIRRLARLIHEKSSVSQDWDKLQLRVQSQDVQVERAMTDLLARTPGIANFSRVRVSEFHSIHDIFEEALTVWQDKLEGKSFCVRVKRNGKHDFTSTDVEKYVGGGLNQHCHSSSVKLKTPDLVVNIEIKDQQCFIVEEKRAGIGGFPVGTQDPVLTLISGGFDSTVASYLMMKRGLRNHFCFFNLGGPAHEYAVKEIAYFLWQRYASSHRVRFLTVPFQSVVDEINRSISPSNVGVVLKRMMLRAAEKVAEKGGIKALVTGEAVAQVSSQTVTNLALIDQVTPMMVLRPLVAMDKPDIITLSRQIGLEDFSASVPEYCGAIVRKPSAKVNPKALFEDEENFNFEVLARALEQTKVQAIDEVMQDSAPHLQIDKVRHLEVDDVVIDIRHPNEQEARPLALAGNEVKLLPFYSLGSQFEKLANDKRYLLYCARGVMSELHCAHLQDAGFSNVAVYLSPDLPLDAQKE